MTASVPTSFLAFSNSRSAKSSLTQAFPSGTVYALGLNEEEGGEMERRDNREGVVWGLVEWIVLGKTKIILHSFGSSFGEESSAINLTPSVRMRLGGNIYGVDLGMEDCNHPQLQNIRVRRGGGGGEGGGGGGGEEICYVDGKDRMVCQPKLIKKLCSEVKERWGIEDVYC